MNSESGKFSDTFSQELVDRWNAVITKSGQTHDLGQTPEWCRRWVETYRPTFKRLIVFSNHDSVYPFMIRRVAGLRVIMWLGQEHGMESDYCGGSGSYQKLLDVLQELKGWDVARLQLPHWQTEAGNIVKAVHHYEKYLWRIEASFHSVVIPLPECFEEWQSALGRESRRKVRACLDWFSLGTSGFEILRGAEIYPAIDDLIANNAKRWNVLTRSQDAAFLKKTVRDLENNSNLFLARLYRNGSTWASVLGYQSGSRVFLHTAGILRERDLGVSPGIMLYILLIQRLISEKVRFIDFCPGLEQYKFHLGGHWEPGHSIIFSRNRLACCRYRAACSAAEVSRALWSLIRRKVRIKKDR